MTALGVFATFALLAAVAVFFAVEADRWQGEAEHWEAEYDEAVDGWSEALKNGETALRLLEEYDAAAEQLLSEVLPQTRALQVWVNPN